jgi:hypothetical protein
MLPLLATRMLTASALLALTILTPSRAAAQSWEGAATEDHPVLPVVYVDTAPHIDGLLDDPAWSHATVLDGFYVPNLDRAPTEATVVQIVADSAYLYFAIRCFDANPERISMEQTRRGSALWSDDYVEIRLDIEHLHRWRGIYEFRVNPRGTQDEEIPDGSASKIEWRGDWIAQTRVDSLGWTAEVAIPLIIFNRPAGPHDIGLSFWRYQPRTREQSQWPNMGKDPDRTRTGDWTGIVWPKRAFRPTIMPYVVGAGVLHGETLQEMELTDRDAYAGVDVKYTTASGIAVVGTVYPDFRNVESDILDLDFSYTERYRSDRRPFFQEGHEYLPESWMFYSNRVREMYGGVKAFGQLGSHRIGFLDAYDTTGVNHMAGKWLWQPQKHLEIESDATWRHGAEDADIRSGVGKASDHVMMVSHITKSHRSNGFDVNNRLQGGFTHTPSDTGNGYNFEFHHERFSNRMEIVANFRQLGPGFVPAGGLLDPQDSDQRDIGARLEYYREHDRDLFRRWSIWASTQRAVRFNNKLYRQSARFSGWTVVTANTGFWAAVDVEKRPPYTDHTFESQIWWNDQSLYTGGSVNGTLGKIGGADYLLVGVNQGIHPLRYVTMELRSDYRRREFPVGHRYRPDGDTENRFQTVGTLQYDITPEHAVSGRIIYSDNWDDTPVSDRLNGYVTYRQVVRRGVDMFLIIGDPRAQVWTRRLALKAMFVI